MNSKEYHGYTVFEDGTVIGKYGKIRKPDLLKSGYLRLTLRVDEKKVRVLLHRLVAELFLDSREGKSVINHLDGDKLNNNATNLEWCTHSENSKHAVSLGLIKTSKVEGTNTETGEVLVFDPMNDAKHFGFQPQNISSCCLGKRKIHKKHTWRFL